MVPTFSTGTFPWLFHLFFAKFYSLCVKFPDWKMLFHCPGFSLDVETMFDYFLRRIRQGWLYSAKNLCNCWRQNYGAISHPYYENANLSSKNWKVKVKICAIYLSETNINIGLPFSASGLSFVGRILGCRDIWPFGLFYRGLYGLWSM